MKKGLLILLMGILFILTGCDNNKGPFQVKNENGIKVLYSGKKPAKGWVEQNIYNYTGESTKVYEIYFEDGLPAGDFRLFDTKGNLVVDAEGKWKDGLFKGKIKEEYNNVYAKGTFSINTDFLINFEGERYISFSRETLIDGDYKSEYLQYSKKNNRYEGEYIKYDKDGLAEKGTYKNGKLEGKYFSAPYANKTYSSTYNYKNGVKDGEFVITEGKVRIEGVYENGEEVKEKRKVTYENN